MTARALRAGSAARVAAELICRVGPMHRAALFSQIDFGATSTNRNVALDAAIENGLLHETLDGIVVTAAARAIIEREHPELAPAKYIGQVAAPRTPRDASSIPPLSRRFIPNSKGLRADVPQFSVRSDARYRSLAGGAA